MRRVGKFYKKLVRLVLGLCLASSVVLAGIHLIVWMVDSDLRPNWVAYVVVVGMVTGCYMAILWGMKGIWVEK